MNPFFLLFLNASILSVNCFFYTLLPLTVINRNDKSNVYCPWNKANPDEIKCGLNNGVMGYYHVKPGTVSLPDPRDFLNPAIQKLFSNDNCEKLKKEWASEKDKGTVCNKFSSCFNVGDDKSVCTCQRGFFGNPYEGCKQHCLTDDDCTSPVAKCSTNDENSQLNMCVCKPGYEGDGVMCYKNPCGNDRSSKCGTDLHKLCVPTGPNENDYKCVCQTGYYMDHEKVCVKERTVTRDTVISLVGKNVKDGSRVEVGNCFSFVLNDKTKSIFFHKNSGDSVYVKRKIKNDKQFSIFFIVTQHITAFSQMESSFGLTKLYSMTNTLDGCKFGRVRVFDPMGHEYSEDDEDSTERAKTETTSTMRQGASAGVKPEAASDSALEMKSKAESGKDPATKTEAAKPVAQESDRRDQQTNRNTRRATDSQNKTTQRPKEPMPVVELYVRDLTEGEKAGGLSGIQLPESMVKRANSSDTETSQVSQSSSLQVEATTVKGKIAEL